MLARPRQVTRKFIPLALREIHAVGNNRAMNGITIYVDWTYFLGIVGTLIGIAYYANGRFTKIETTVEWLKEILLEIKERLEDGKTPPRGALNSRPFIDRRRDLRTDQTSRRR
jgi:hypothetical protein